MDDDEVARRRELQRRAFAPDGGLTPAEVEELRQLTQRNWVPERGPRAPEAPDDAERRSELGVGIEGSEPGQGAPTSSATQEEASSATQESTPATGIRPLAILAAAVALVLGIGIGWFAFGRDTGPALTAEQQDTWAKLQASPDYDPGSVSFIDANHGVAIWHATKDNGELECAIATSADVEEHSCSPLKQLDTFGLQVSIHSAEDPDAQIWAMISESGAGEWVAFIQRQTGMLEWDWRDSYQGDELVIAEFLDSEGYAGQYLQLIGYDADLPIWLHQGGQQCLIVASADAVLGQACGAPEVNQTLDLSLANATYSLRMSESRGPQLTVIRSPASEHCPECNAIDDKTGD